MIDVLPLDGFRHFHNPAVVLQPASGGVIDSSRRDLAAQPDRNLPMFRQRGRRQAARVFRPRRVWISTRRAPPPVADVLPATARHGRSTLRLTMPDSRQRKAAWSPHPSKLAEWENTRITSRRWRGRKRMTVVNAANHSLLSRKPALPVRDKKTITSNFPNNPRISFLTILGGLR